MSSTRRTVAWALATIATRHDEAGVIEAFETIVSQRLTLVIFVLPLATKFSEYAIQETHNNFYI